MHFYGILNNRVEIFRMLRAQWSSSPPITNHVYAHVHVAREGPIVSNTCSLMAMAIGALQVGIQLLMVIPTQLSFYYPVYICKE